jgi:hypothetical protein
MPDGRAAICRQPQDSAGEQREQCKPVAESFASVRKVRRQRRPRSHVCSFQLRSMEAITCDDNRIRAGANMTRLRRIVAKGGTAGALSPHALSL